MVYGLGLGFRGLGWFMGQVWGLGVWGVGFRVSGFSNRPRI